MPTYENTLSTKLEAVESCGFKAVRDARKELVVQIEKELVELEKKVIQALGVGEQEEKAEKVGELMDEEVEKRMGSVTQVPEASALEAMGGSRDLPTTSRIDLSQPADSNTPEL